VDITAKPYCMVNLGGVQFDLGTDISQGGRNDTDGDRHHSFYHAHWYNYPVLEWLGVLDDAICMQKGDFDLGYLSELDPTWDDDELSFLINPEATLFSSILLQASCGADSLASAVGTSIDSLFWCMGSQGSTYPLTGHVGFENSALSASTLLTERLNFKLHRLGMLWDSEGVDGLVCAEYPHPILPKSRYRYQMVNTIPDVLSCHPFGRTTMSWEWLKQTPATPKEFGYLIWKKRNCVAF
jgi:conjugal transfer pilus assembly protein TraU